MPLPQVSYLQYLVNYRLLQETKKVLSQTKKREVNFTFFLKLNEAYLISVVKAINYLLIGVATVFRPTLPNSIRAYSYLPHSQYNRVFHLKK